MSKIYESLKMTMLKTNEDYSVLEDMDVSEHFTATNTLDELRKVTMGGFQFTLGAKKRRGRTAKGRKMRKVMKKVYRANKAKIQRALKRWRMSSEGKRKMKALAKLRAKLRRESIEEDIRGMFAQTSAVQNKWKALISQAVDHLGKTSMYHGLHPDDEEYSEMRMDAIEFLGDLTGIFTEIMADGYITDDEDEAYYADASNSLEALADRFMEKVGELIPGRDEMLVLGQKDKKRMGKWISHRVFLIAGKLIKSGRKLILKLQEDWAYQEEYKEAERRLRQFLNCPDSKASTPLIIAGLNLEPPLLSGNCRVLYPTDF